ncbi:hypothetical protein J1N10_07385 [Carboxylicivirga sp. A043]|uniref:hypothetical protein n=1 Tax=Carboxylicivirga litoralis TaxID=2816963 RepID=UPI0021CB7A32|nr:hypothetical protein [Carboxylicivirga sp. A043]MCU4155795.1 hypothetical protein [Carboxylicivirga sp. A043]
MMFAIQIASNALFYHTHTIDGKSYSHAHPGCDGHSHNAADFAFYQQLQNMLSDETPKLLSDILPSYIETIQMEIPFFINEQYLGSNSGRAPPVA